MQCHSLRCKKNSNSIEENNIINYRNKNIEEIVERLFRKNNMKIKCFWMLMIKMRKNECGFDKTKNKKFNVCMACAHDLCIECFDKCNSEGEIKCPFCREITYEGRCLKFETHWINILYNIVFHKMIKDIIYIKLFHKIYIGKKII